MRKLDVHPYVAGKGTRLFDDVPKSSNGTVGLQYRRHRERTRR